MNKALIIPAMLVLFSCLQEDVLEHRSVEECRLQSPPTTKDNFSMPTFPGGIAALRQYLKKNNKWRSGRLCIEGYVLVQFIVSETGRVTNPFVIRGLCESCDKEALRLITEMPDWNPGTANGTTRTERVVVPIEFGRGNQYE